MAAFVRTHDDSTWTTGNYVTVQSDWESLANKLTAGINAERGGAWAPSSPIEFTAANLRVHGHTLVAFGGSIIGASPDPFRMKGAGEWPRFAAGHPLRQRKILQSLLFAHHDTPDMWMVHGASLASVAIVVQQVDGVQYRPHPLSLPLRVHDGAKLARATLTFRVLSERNKSPVALPRFRIIRVDKFGESQPLQSVSAGADVNGWISPPAASKTSGAAWYANGAPQTLAATCDQNNVVDIEQYTYWAEVEEEKGPNRFVSRSEFDGVVVRERKSDVRAASSGNTRPDLFDGTPDPEPADGVRYLFMHGYRQTFSPIYELGAVANGIWTLGADESSYFRTPDLDSVDDITPGCFVVAEDGIVNRRRAFEVIEPVPQRLGPYVDVEVDGLADGYPGVAISTAAEPYVRGYSPLLFGPLRPAGNAYSTVLLEFEDIVDMRFQ